MVGWHHWLDGRKSEWTPGVGDGQGGLACCDSWGRKESDTTERLNWTELNWCEELTHWKGTWCWVRLKAGGEVDDRGWGHRLDGHDFGQAPGVGDGQRSLAWCSPWGRKESDTTEQLNWTDVWQEQWRGDGYMCATDGCLFCLESSNTFKC